MSLEANKTYPHVCMDVYAHFPLGWKDERFLVGKPLTDHKINRYEKRGFYSEEFRQQRKDYQAKKKGRVRSGNFIKADDGRFIYSPI